MKNKKVKAIKTFNRILEELLAADAINDILSIISRYGGHICANYRVEHGRRVLISGEIKFTEYRNDNEDYEIGAIIYRSKGSLFCSCHEWYIPGEKLPPEKVELINGVF